MWKFGARFYLLFITLLIRVVHRSLSTITDVKLNSFIYFSVFSFIILKNFSSFSSPVLPSGFILKRKGYKIALYMYLQLFIKKWWDEVTWSDGVASGQFLPAQPENLNGGSLLHPQIGEQHVGWRAREFAWPKRTTLHSERHASRSRTVLGKASSQRQEAESRCKSETVFTFKVEI